MGGERVETCGPRAASYSKEIFNHRFRIANVDCHVVPHLVIDKVSESLTRVDSLWWSPIHIVLSYLSDEVILTEPVK